MIHYDYHIFLSYAHSDDIANEWVPKFVQSMGNIFKEITGQDLKLFLDVREITTAQLWEERIRTSLEQSTLLVALLSPAYFVSDWCCKEWDYFQTLETEKRQQYGLPVDRGLIFP